MNKKIEIAIKRINVFIIPLTTYFGPDRPSAGDMYKNTRVYDDGII
jgi:hypothetical protein